MKERRRVGEGGRLGATEAGTEKRDEGLNRLRIKKKKTLLYNRRDKQLRIIWIRMDYFCKPQSLKH